MKLISTNPAKNHAVVGEVDVSTPADVRAKVAEAQAAKKTWRELGLGRRIELLRPIQKELEMRREEIAELICREVGKPIKQSLSEARGYPQELNWFFDNAPVALKDEVTHEDNRSMHKIVYEPIGVAAVITPWNFPFGMALWGIIPNLIAGNPVVFKTSEECPLVGKLLDEVFHSHELPKGVFAEVYGSGEVGKQLAESDVDLIWFTGSSRTGRSLYKTAADKFIKVVLEMGGSNPCVVFNDADVSVAAELIYSGRFYNCGQVCDATKRLIVHEDIKERLLAGIKLVLESKKVGDPADEETDIGSLVARRQLDLLREQVADAMSKGATVSAQLPLGEGLHGDYYPPTVLDNITKDMRVWSEEVFGPVLPVLTFRTEEEAIALANDTPYGLGSRIITNDVERAKRVASQLEAGTVEVNEGNHWLTCNPFGGYKNSGMGREHGLQGFRELSQLKVISSSK